MKILLTGGHFSPALSVIEVLQKRKHEIMVIGRKYPLEGDSATSFEFQVCTEKKIPFKNISAGRIQRKFTRHSFSSFFSIPRGFFQAQKILQEFSPDVILTFGGYLSFPVACAAFMQKIPVVIHEQTQHAGLANKIIAKIAKHVCISFESSSKYFPKNKITFTGNPLRKEIFEIKKKLDIPQGHRVVYITGGSTGSHAINKFIASVLPDLLKTFVVIHQTGDSHEFSDFEKLEDLKNSLPKELQRWYIVKKFISPEEIGWVLKSADIVIARAGINTILELIALKKRCLLIPLPHGQVNEQLYNAKLAKTIGIGDYIEQNSLTRDVFFEKVHQLMEEKIMVSSHHELYIPDAAERIVDVVQLAYEEKK